MIEGFAIDGKIIHENLHDLLNHVRENRHHAPLERSWSIAQSERHSSVCISSIRACKGSLFLVIWVDWDLVISRITIKETKERVVCKPFQHFINEG